jgi:hypothetical protein
MCVCVDRERRRMNGGSSHNLRYQHTRTHTHTHIHSLPVTDTHTHLCMYLRRFHLQLVQFVHTLELHASPFRVADEQAVVAQHQRLLAGAHEVLLRHVLYMGNRVCVCVRVIVCMCIHVNKHMYMC